MLALGNLGAAEEKGMSKLQQSIANTIDLGGNLGICKPPVAADDRSLVPPPFPDVSVREMSARLY